MGHGKETPRQKMIGMMYLVLTAMLALNVSKDILEAFVLVDDGLTKTTINFSEKNQFIYKEFEKMAVSNPVKVGPWKKEADTVHARADRIYNDIQRLKIEIVKLADGPEALAIDKDGKIEGKKINSKDNTDKPAQIMVGDNNDKEGKKLKKKIEDFREHLLSLVDKKNTTLIAAIKSSLDTEDPEASKDGTHHTWESEHFEHLPLIAVTTIMTKMQGDIRNAESDMIKYLFNQIDAGSINFNKIEATVIPNATYVIKGNEYNAEVFISASDTTQFPSVYVGSYETVTGPDGKPDIRMVGRYDSLSVDPKSGRAIYKRTASTIGSNKWGGIIQIKAPDGSVIKRPFKMEYQVAEPMIVVSPTKMNVFYIGVDNPVSVSVPGIPTEKITATISNGVIQRNGKEWVVRPKTPGNATVNVVAEIDGNKKNMGSLPFRVKTLPDPVAKVGGSKGGSMEKNLLSAQQVVIADMENFDFDAPFKVTEFTIAASIKGFTRELPSKGNRITDEQRDLLKGMNKGDRVTFTDIKAVGPDGRVRELNGVIFKVK
jgi:gliding motility-associated protein GldM